jgi:trk system potassium uptake protein TrkH
MSSLLGVVNVLGSLLALFSLYFLLPIATALAYREASAVQFLACGVAIGALGLLLRALTARHKTELKPRDGYVLVSLGWLGVAAVAAVPLMVLIPGLSFTDAFFETLSSLSNTGYTVLRGIDTLPHSVNLWRHALCWLGGMGIIVLAVAVLPLLGVGGMQMYRAEAPGPVKDAKLTPRITETAKLLWLVYAGMTAACALAYWAAGMPLFDAVCHSFSTMSLAGTSTHDRSIGYYGSPLIEFVAIVFMLLSAINFSTHFVAVRKRAFGQYGRDPEARWMLLWIIASCIGLSSFIYELRVYPDYLPALRQVSFNLVSLATTTGYVSTDYGQWPIFAPLWMLFLSCICASTGSTGGGIKLFRTLVLIKQSFREMFTLVHPQAVLPLKINGLVVPNRVVYSVLAFIFLYFMTIVTLTFALLASGLDLVSSLTAIIASINNAGPGLGAVGPAGNYGGLSDFQTWMCTTAMFHGRTEIFTFVLLFTPTFWRK